MVRSLVLFILLLLAGGAFAQSVRSGDLGRVMEEYERSGRDTNRVRWLLRIDTIYLYKMPDTKVILDSALLMARQAAELSASLHFEEGYREAEFLVANSFAEQNDIHAAIAFTSAAKDSSKVHMLMMLGDHYIFKQGDLRKNLDSAYPFIAYAIALSDSLHSRRWFYRSLGMKGKYYFSGGEIGPGKACFMQIIRDYHREGNKEREAFWWSEFANYLPDTDSTYADETGGFLQARALYGQLRDTLEEMTALSNLAFLHNRHKQVGLALTEYEENLRILKLTGNVHLLGIYNSLATLNLSIGNYNRSLFYSLAAVRNLDSTGDRFLAGNVYSRVGYAYAELGEAEKSVGWYKRALDYLVASRAIFLFPDCAGVVHGLLLLGRPEEALAFLQRFVKEKPPASILDEEIVAWGKGECYHALGNDVVAEKHYLSMIRLDEQEELHRKVEIAGSQTGMAVISSGSYAAIGQFYIDMRRYEMARVYLVKALTVDHQPPPLTRLRDIEWMLFRVDSAAGNYLSAIGHFERQKLLNDSIFSISKSHQIEELQIDYDTKEQQKNIQVLTSEGTLKDQELRQSGQVRKFTYLLVAILIVLMGVGYSRYRLKQKSNRQLQDQQDKINLQYSALRELHEVQDKLLVEKEWLVKEIHHRVKNSLQIIMSLLNTQASGLEEGDALAAIRASRQRMEAISLIHQKLYKVENTAMMDMHGYIHELVGNLRDSMAGDRNIYFDIRVEKLQLDVAEAIPIGLILNEAITNSMKYAFAGREAGAIAVALGEEGGTMLLTVADNGVGLPDGMDWRESHSMGMELIATMAEQLEGEITVSSEGGVRIGIRFNKRSC